MPYVPPTLLAPPPPSGGGNSLLNFAGIVAPFTGGGGVALLDQLIQAGGAVYGAKQADKAAERQGKLELERLRAQASQGDVTPGFFSGPVLVGLVLAVFGMAAVLAIGTRRR